MRFETKPTTIRNAVALIFALELVLVVFVWKFGWSHVVATYHFNDIPESETGWFAFFFWAVLAIPVAWAGCLALAIVELVRAKRIRLLCGYAGMPVGLAFAYWLAWQTFVRFVA